LLFGFLIQNQGQRRSKSHKLIWRNTMQRYNFSRERICCPWSQGERQDHHKSWCSHARFQMEYTQGGRHHRPRQHPEKKLFHPFSRDTAMLKALAGWPMNTGHTVDVKSYRYEQQCATPARKNFSAQMTPLRCLVYSCLCLV
jgi:hypothetical protein